MEQILLYIFCGMLGIALIAGVTWFAFREKKEPSLPPPPPPGSPAPPTTPAPLVSTPTPATPARSWNWIWWLLIIIVAIFIGRWVWVWYEGQGVRSAYSPPRMTAPGKLSFSPLLLEATSYKKSASWGIIPDTAITPPEVVVKEGGKIVFSFFVGEVLPKDKSVLIKAILVPQAANPQTQLGDPTFSIGDSPNQKIHLRGGPQEVILGCPAREMKKGENLFSYKSGGMPFKVSGLVRVELSP